MELNRYIDHTQLRNDARHTEIDKLITEAKEFNFKAICINPSMVAYAKEQLKDTTTGVCTVIGFPLGANTTAVKVFETTDAINNGADEIDMVINLTEMKEGNYTYVENEIRLIKEACGDTTLKVIVETCLLTDEEKVVACNLVENAGAEYIKTSTGTSTGGATIEDVTLFKNSLKKDTLIKAAGGVRTKADTEAMIAAGASRIGTSGGVKIVQGEEHTDGY